ncbi:MAG: hypothetical protein AMDU4_FER2C00283G0002 [Ferroplasma sp. Type II]|nr:MAG: hypothetical protein AMDU4_FER2C00283G0002 [Ferroplasma sp. Type II]
MKTIEILGNPYSRVYCEHNKYETNHIIREIQDFKLSCTWKENVFCEHNKSTAAQNAASIIFLQVILSLHNVLNRHNYSIF